VSQQWRVPANSSSSNPSPSCMGTKNFIEQGVQRNAPLLLKLYETWPSDSHPSFSQDVCYMIDWRSPPFSPIAGHNSRSRNHLPVNPFLNYRKTLARRRTFC
jgi:hypothetical protein